MSGQCALLGLVLYTTIGQLVISCHLKPCHLVFLKSLCFLKICPTNPCSHLELILHVVVPPPLNMQSHQAYVLVMLACDVQFWLSTLGSPVNVSSFEDQTDTFVASSQ